MRAGLIVDAQKSLGDDSGSITLAAVDTLSERGGEATLTAHLRKMYLFGIMVVFWSNLHYKFA